MLPANLLVQWLEPSGKENTYRGLTYFASLKIPMSHSLLLKLGLVIIIDYSLLLTTNQLEISIGWFSLGCIPALRGFRLRGLGNLLSVSSMGYA